MTQASTPQKWYSIRSRTALAAVAQGATQPAASAAEIFIYGDIGESWWGDTVTAAQFVKDLEALDVQAITVRINSYGGSVTDGIAIHNAIKRHPASVTIAIDGLAASIASLIAMAGDTVEISENAMLMVHAPWGGVSGNSAALRDYADMLDKWAAAMATSYSSKSGMAAADALALLTDGQDHWYTAAEAKAAGLVDTVVSAMPEAASAMASASLEAITTRYRTAPASLVQRIPVAAATPTPEKPMTVQTTAAPAKDPATLSPEDRAAIEASARTTALAADKQRRADIGAAFAKFAGVPGVSALQTACEADHEVNAAAAGQKLLALLGANATPIAGHVTTEHDETDKRISAMAESVMARAALSDASGKPIRATGANPYRGAKLLDLARASLGSSGLRTEGMDQMSMVAAAFTQSGSDFPILLENIMHKTVQNAYAISADTWTRFCKRGSVSDFRVNKRYRVGSLSVLEAKTELGEFRNKTIPDGERGSITAATKGNIINISREAIVNDDLGAFVGLADALGRAAKRTVEADVYAYLVSNPTLDDGIALFHASHGNLLAAGTVISTANVDLVRQAMASQMDVGANDYLAITPSVLVCPLALGGLAREVNGAEYNDDSNKQQRKPNVVRGLYSDIVDTPRLSGTAWYSFAAASEAPVIEVAFLDGNDVPYVELQNGFTVDGSQWKVRLDFGIAATDWRGAYKNPGA